MALFLTNDIESIYLGNEEIEEVYLGSELVWSAGLPIGQTFTFDYTGTVQEVTLPPGRYKLQVWGAQGGTSSGSSSGVGSRGGYSEGELTLTETKTLYIFVGGKGGSSGKGGWNGGGYSSGSSSWDSSGTYGRSRPACGGGATDIALVSSDMSYDSYRTNRSSESLLSRFIAAGGGAGGSYRYTETETTNTNYLYEREIILTGSWIDDRGRYCYHTRVNVSNFEIGGVYQFIVNFDTDLSTIAIVYYSDGTSNGYITSQLISNGGTFTFLSNNAQNVEISARYSIDMGDITPVITIYKQTTTTSTSTDSSYSGNSKQGGGTSGRGQYPGTQTSAGQNGGFGYGANMTTTNYRYCSGAGGGGWYGGGSAYSDSSTSYIGYTGGGSGFVNIAANASYRPSGYTGLQLDSGTTYQGNSSFPNTAGTGNETGHKGNGYAKITVIK